MTWAFKIFYNYDPKLEANFSLKFYHQRARISEVIKTVSNEDQLVY